MENVTPPIDGYAELMSSVGTALHSWAMVESAMGILFGGVSGIRNYTAAGAIFDTILSFDVRLAVLTTAMEYCPHYSGEEKELWSCLARRIRSLYKKRHALAHFAVSREDMISGRQISPFFSWHKQLVKAERFLTISEIYARSKKFNEASHAVGWFTNLHQRRALPPRSQPHPVEEPALIVRIRESLARSQ